MSIKVQSYVWEHSRAKGSALLLLLAIADFAHDDGTGAWPSRDTLAQKCRQTVRNVDYLLGKLEAMSEVKIDVGGGPHGCNAYVIPLTGAKFAGEKFSPLKTSADGGENQREEGRNPARQISPEPLGTIIESSESRQDDAPAQKEETPVPDDSPKGLARTFLLTAMHRNQLNGDTEAFAELWNFCNQPALYQKVSEQWANLHPKSPIAFRDFRTMLYHQVYQQKKAEARSGP